MTETAIFAGGCFWGVQYYFDQVPGVLTTDVGYIGGHQSKPSYEQVCGGTTGHAEAVKIVFDSSKISYSELLKHFFRLHDPTQLDRQGPDIGSQYRTAIFYLTEEQKAQAIKTIEQLNYSKKYTKPVVTKIEPATEFWEAEAYHQKFTERTGRGICHVPYAPV